jgi:hypothetical protein
MKCTTVMAHLPHQMGNRLKIVDMHCYRKNFSTDGWCLEHLLTFTIIRR